MPIDPLAPSDPVSVSRLARILSSWLSNLPMAVWVTVVG